MLIIGLLLAATVVVGGIVLFLEIRNAPEGFEDRNGFHFGSRFKVAPLARLTALGSARKQRRNATVTVSRLGLSGRKHLKPSRQEAVVHQAN
jgi:hypothetical protein